MLITDIVISGSGIMMYYFRAAENKYKTLQVS